MEEHCVQVNVDYSAVSLEDIIIDALPLKDGKMIGVSLRLIVSFGNACARGRAAEPRRRMRMR
jgi:hypothetical protein